MIRIILNGCNGRMGQVLTKTVEDQDDMMIVAGIDIENGSCSYPVFPSFSSCLVEGDVLVDFSTPQAMTEYLPVAMQRHLPVVVATTGLSDSHLKMLEEASAVIPVFRSANMSLGINVVRQLLQSATKALGERYDIEIVERHHRQKKDAPSGTALMLAESINNARSEKLRHVCGRSGSEMMRSSDELGIHSVRQGTIVGEHEVSFAGQDEVITIGHQAYSRQIFATGALAAVRYIIRQKNGLYSMEDMINESYAVTTLTTFPDEVLVSLEDVPRDMGVISDVYGGLASRDVFIDMISHTGATNDHLSISFTINGKDQEKTKATLHDLAASYPSIRYAITETVTKLVVEGPGMEFQSGVAYRVFSCMAKMHIPVLAVTTSEVKISCVTANEDVPAAISALKEEFGI